MRTFQKLLKTINSCEEESASHPTLILLVKMRCPKLQLGQAVDCLCLEMRITCWNPKPGHHHCPSSLPSKCQNREYDGIENSKLPRASETPGVSAAIVWATAEQEAPHSEILRHSTAIGCLLLSINPTLLKEMSGNTESVLS